MNFYPNNPIPNIPINMVNNGMDYMNQIFNKFNEFEGRIKRVEQRITRLENENKTNDYNSLEPDKSLYML